MSWYKFTWSSKDMHFRDFSCHLRCGSMCFPVATSRVGCWDLSQGALLAGRLPAVVPYLPVVLPQFV